MNSSYYILKYYNLQFGPTIVIAREIDDMLIDEVLFDNSNFESNEVNN